MIGDYLEGGLAPVDDELDVLGIPVAGEIPEGLRGTYVRNGPNPAFQPGPSYHLFDGDGMLHAVTFEDAGVSYRNRWVVTPGLVAERRAGRALFGGMRDLTVPAPELVEEVGPVKNPANTNVIHHQGRYLALWEAGSPTALTLELETIGPYDFSGELVGPMTAHPKMDPVDGQLLFFGYSPVPPYLRYHVVDASGKLVRSVDIDLPAPVMMHDFVVTREHVVFFDLPAAFDLQGFLRGEPMVRWAPERGARVGVMPRAGDADDLRWIEIEPQYVFHFLNAWSDADRVHVTGASTAWLTIDYENEKAPEGVDPASYLTSFTIDLARGTCTTERIGERPGEFCKIPDTMAGVKNRYGYLATFSEGVQGGVNFDSLTKYDLETGRQTLHAFGRDRIVGEPAFAPDPAGTAEDDGWIVAYVHARDGSASELVVLDARDFAAAPVARVPMPRRVPVGFHGNWVPARG